MIQNIIHTTKQIWDKYSIYKILKISWIVIALAFISIALWKSQEILTQITWTSESILLFIAALGASLLRKLVAAIRWVWILRTFQKQALSFTHILYIYFISNLAMHLPGTYWFIPIRMAMHKKTAISAIETGIGILFEHISLIIAGLLVSIWGLDIIAQFLGLASPPIWWYISSIIIIMVFSHPIFFNLLIYLANKIFKKPIEDSLKFSYLQIILFILWSSLIWIFGGLSLVFLSQIFNIYISLADWTAFTAIFAISWLVGFFTPFAPNGLGIREGILGFFFVSIGMPLAIGILISLLSRILIILEDILWAGFSVLFFKKSNI